MLLYILTAILILTVIYWRLQKTYPRLICPVCIASVSVWLILLALFMLGKLPNPSLLIVLVSISLGASLERFGKKFGLLWKTLSLILGVTAIYFLQDHNFAKTFVFVTALLFVTFLLHTFKKKNQNLHDNFKNCCD